MALRTDGFQNLHTGLGVAGLDSMESRSFQRDTLLDYEQMGELHRFDGLAKRVVNLPARDVFKSGFSIDGDTDGVVFSALKKNRIFAEFKEAVVWADVFGGSLLVLGLNDGNDSSEPLNEGKLTSIGYATTYTPQDVSTWTIDEDTASSNYGKPLVYELYTAEGKFVYVHYSRIIRIDGERLSKREFEKNNYWHDSVYQTLFKYLSRVSNAHANSEKILSEAYIYVMKMQGLIEMLASGDEQEVVKRLMNNDMTRSLMSMVAIDSESEDLTRNTVSVSGISDLVTKIEEGVCMITGIPYSLLMGSSPKGLSTGDSTGMEFYYDKLTSKQEDQLQEPLARLSTLMATAIGYSTEVSVTFAPVERVSRETEIATKKVQAEVDALYLQAGVLYADEVRDSRFGGESFSYDTELGYSSPNTDQLEA